MKMSIRDILIGFVLLLGFGLEGNSQGLFSSGSTNAQNEFPPSTFTTATYSSLVVDMKGGTVSAITATGAVVANVSLPGREAIGDAFPTGEFNFSTFTVPAGVTLKFLHNTLNTAVTVRASGDVLIAGVIDLRGVNGGAANITGIAIGGRGGPGGASGGPGGAPNVPGRSEMAGGNGLGRNGGAGGDHTCCAEGYGSGQGGTFPHSNINLLPLIGGSGGGGGRGATANGDGTTGGGGGGGGGAILIASSTKIAITGTIDVSGGAGGGNAISGFDRGKGAGGGSGGGIRIISNRVEFSGSLLAEGGVGGANFGGAGGIGIVRVEGLDIVVTGGSIKPAATSGTPGIIRPSNLPRLRISSIGGVSVPEIAGGNLGTVDVQIPGAGSSTVPSNPMAIVVTATNIPDTTKVTVSIKKTEGGITTADANLSNGSATVNMTLPTGVSFIQAHTAIFTVTAELQKELPLFNGEKILQASIEFDGSRERSYFFTESGRRVSSEDLFAGR